MKYLTEIRFRESSRAGKFSSAALIIAFAILDPSGVLSCRVAAQERAEPRMPDEEPVSGLINPAAIQFSPATEKVDTVDSNANSVKISDDQSNTTASRFIPAH